MVRIDSTSQALLIYSNSIISLLRKHCLDPPSLECIAITSGVMSFLVMRTALSAVSFHVRACADSIYMQCFGSSPHLLSCSCCLQWQEQQERDEGDGDGDGDGGDDDDDDEEEEEEDGDDDGDGGGGGGDGDGDGDGDDDDDDDDSDDGDGDGDDDDGGGDDDDDDEDVFDDDDDDDDESQGSKSQKCARLLHDILVVQRTQHNHFTTLPKAKSLNSVAQQRHKASIIH